jgi:hypothetical protein
MTGVLIVAAVRRIGLNRANPAVANGLQLVPDEKGVDSLTKQIRMTGRAYPLFDIALDFQPERCAVS